MLGHEVAAKKVEVRKDVYLCQEGYKFALILLPVFLFVLEQFFLNSSYRIFVKMLPEMNLWIG